MPNANLSWYINATECVFMLNEWCKMNRTFILLVMHRMLLKFKYELWNNFFCCTCWLLFPLKVLASRNFVWNFKFALWIFRHNKELSLIRSSKGSNICFYFVVSSWQNSLRILLLFLSRWLITNVLLVFFVRWNTWEILVW